MITLLLSFSLTSGWAQRPSVKSSSEGDERVELEVEMHRKAQLQQEKKRFEEMKRDSQRLLELATELKNYVDNASEEILSLEVIRKAEEMEKLARQVKNNMRGD
jgi:hypothetical protein